MLPVQERFRKLGYPAFSKNIAYTLHMSMQDGQPVPQTAADPLVANLEQMVTDELQDNPPADPHELPAHTLLMCDEPAAEGSRGGSLRGGCGRVSGGSDADLQVHIQGA